MADAGALTAPCSAADTLISGSKSDSAEAGAPTTCSSVRSAETGILMLQTALEDALVTVLVACCG